MDYNIPNINNTKPLIKKIMKQSPCIQEFCKLNNKDKDIRKKAHIDIFEGTDEQFEMVYNLFGYDNDEVLINNFKNTMSMVGL